MTYFADDLKAYLITQNLIDSGTFIDFAEDTTENAGELTAINFYDSNAPRSEYSIQFVCRRENQIEALGVVGGIYSHLFGDKNPPENKSLIINTEPCLFIPKSQPGFLKRENQMYNYYFDCAVIVGKI